MNRNLNVFLFCLMAYSSLSAIAATPDGYRFAHAGWCTSQEIMEGYFNHSYWAGGKDGGSQRNVCLMPESTIESLQSFNVEPVFDVLLNLNGQTQRVRCCGGHHMPRECPCPD